MMGRERFSSMNAQRVSATVRISSTDGVRSFRSDMTPYPPSGAGPAPGGGRVRRGAVPASPAASNQPSYPRLAQDTVGLFARQQDRPGDPPQAKRAGAPPNFAFGRDRGSAPPRASAPGSHRRIPPAGPLRAATAPPASP